MRQTQKSNKKYIMYLIIIIFSLIITGCSYSDLTGGSNNNGNSSSVQNNNSQNNYIDNTSKSIKVYLGENINYENNYIISFMTSYFTDKVTPTNPGNTYNYFQAKDKENDTIFLLTTTIKNLNGETLDGDDLPNATLIYDKKYKYNLSTVTETDNGKEIEQYSWYKDIEPLKVKKIWYYKDIPKEIANDNKSLIVEYIINNKIYDLVLR